MKTALVIIMGMSYLSSGCISNVEYYLSGTVHDATKNPISGATVHANFYCTIGHDPEDSKLESELDHTVQSDTEGSYVISHNSTEVIAPPGNSCFEDKVYLVVAKSGYQRKIVKLEIKDGYTLRYNVQLEQ